MIPHVSTRYFPASVNDALFVSSGGCSEAGGLDLPPRMVMDFDAACYPANGDYIVNTAALAAAYKAQAATLPGTGESWPAARGPRAAPELYDLSSLARQVTDYQDQIERLQASSQSIIEQRDQWRLRAQQAEARIANASSSAASSEEQSRYIALKHRLARMLHPDSSSRSMEDKAACETLFAEIWTAIDQIEQPDMDGRYTDLQE
jgi:hypothetical protein